MPSPGFDIRIKDRYHRSEVSLFERAIHSGETVRFYMSQEKADRLPDFLEVTPVDLETEAVISNAEAEVAAAQAAVDAEAADAARVEAEEKAALEAEKPAQDDEE